MRRLRAALAAVLVPDNAPEVRLVRDWLDSWSGIGLLASAPVVADVAVVAAAGLKPFDPKDEEAYLTTAVGMGEILATTVYRDRCAECVPCAMNVGLLVIRVAEREGHLVILDRPAWDPFGSRGPGNPFGNVLPVGGVVAPRTTRPIADHGEWFQVHGHPGAVTHLACERCMFGAR